MWIKGGMEVCRCSIYGCVLREYSINQAEMMVGFYEGGVCMCV